MKYWIGILIILPWGYGTDFSQKYQAVFTASPVVADTSDAPAEVRRLVRLLASMEPEQRARAACALAEEKQDAVAAIPFLLERMGDVATVEQRVCEEFREHWWRWNTREINTVGKEATRALVDIANVTSEPVEEAVMDRLKDDTAHARSNAAWALGAMDHEPAVPLLLQTLSDDTHAPTRKQAAWALGAIGNAAGADGLAAALRDDHPEVREQAAWALGAIGSRKGVEGLIGALKDDHADVREQVAWALGVIGDARAESALIAALKDEDKSVRRQVAWALGHLD